MRKKIRVAIAGVGNCASALVQGTNYYNSNKLDGIGLTAYNLGGIEPGDIEYVAAFDVVDSKVGLDLSQAIFARPNNTVKICDVDKMDLKVERAEVYETKPKQKFYLIICR
jgi:myo-inositol-1-phosphate synthase